MFILAQYYILGKSEWKFSLKGCQWHDAPRIITLGYSGALSRFVEMFRCLIVNFLVLKYVGSVGVSSFAASNSVLAVFWPVIFGMVAVARMLFTIYAGEEDRRSLVDVMKVVMTRGMTLVLVMVAGLILFAEPLTRMFYQDPSDPVYYYTLMGFRLLPLCMPLSLWSLTYVPYAQATDKKTIAVVLPIVDGMIGVVVCSFILIPTMQMNGLYISNILNGVICAAVILVGAWISLKRFPRSLEDMMAIPDHIGVGPEKRMDISITRLEEVTDVSSRVGTFCQSRGIDARRSYFAALCMEEMTGNIVVHGFSKDKKQHSVDIRVVHKDDEIILRIRDNCTAFDPTEYHSLMKIDADGKNAGIQLVYGIAKEVKYQNLLGLNVLTMTI
jgi:anti-sigma regulatory factor (Ser/Thr protein kinase)